jgi:DNA-binding CsgD family transcriptional regulator
MQFTIREQEVLRMLAQGLCNKRIGQQLGISPHTVRDHLSAMLRRTGCTNRVQLALRFGPQPPPPPALTRTLKARLNETWALLKHQCLWPTPTNVVF